MFSLGLFGLFMIFAAIKDIAALECFACTNIYDPRLCTTFQTCGPNQKCYLAIHKGRHGRTFEFSFGCADRSACSATNHLFGKRSNALEYRTRRSLLCFQCCHGENCNSHLRLCPRLDELVHAPTITPYHVTTTVRPTTVSTTTTRVMTTLPTTSAPHIYIQTTAIPVVDPNCKDNEEDGIACASLDMFNLCTTTHSSMLSLAIASTKCRRHCGICTSAAPNTNAPVTPPPHGVCQDFEQDGIKCVYLDLYNMCSDPSEMAYTFAHLKCRKHCNLCNTG